MRQKVRITSITADQGYHIAKKIEVLNEGAATEKTNAANAATASTAAADTAAAVYVVGKPRTAPTLGKPEFFTKVYHDNCL